MIKDFHYVHLKTNWTLPSTRANIVSNENISVSFGKISKWYTDFKPWVFANPTRNDLVPVVSKTFTDIIATANNQASATFYFGKIVPTSFTTHWRFRYQVRVFVPSNLNYSQWADVYLYGKGDTVTYRLENVIYSTSYRSAYYHTLYRAKEAGVTGGYGHLIGESLYSSTNPTSTSYKRTFEVKITEYDGCTFSFFDNVVLYADAPGTGSTNYNALTNFTFTSSGLFPDSNTYDRTYLNERPIAGSNGVKQYSLVAYNNIGRLESFTTSSGTGTSKAFYTTAKFTAGPVIMYYGGSADIASGSVIGSSAIYPEITTVDMRYSANVTTSVGFTLNKVVYLEIEFDSDGYWHPTANGFVQEGSFTSGKYYIHIGVAPSVYQISLADQHPILYWDGTKFISRDDHDYAKSDHTHNVFTTTTNGFVPAPTSSNTGKFLKGDGTWATPSNTDTKVNVVTRGTTKSYLLATTTTPTSTAQAVTSVAETGVYLDTTAGKLVATSFSGNGSALTNLNASNLASGTVPIARIPTGTSSTTVALGNHTHSYAGSASAGGAANSVANKLSIYYNTTKAYDYDGSAAKSLTIKAGSNVTVTGNTNGEITIAATNTNTDTKVTQAYSTTNNSYPLLMSATAGVTSTSSRGDTTSILNNRLYGNPSSGILYAGGVIATQTSDTEARAVRIESPTFNFGLHIGQGGENHGIYDFNKVSGSSTGDWILYSDDTDNTKNYHLKGSAAAIGTAPGTLTSKGSSTNPVYFSNGVPVACSSTFGIYAAGTGLSLSGNTFNHSNSVTAKTTQGLYPIAYDAQGHITASGSAVTTLKNPTALTLKYGTTTAWTYDGSAAKTITIKAGTNVTVAGDTSGNITISATDTTYTGTSPISVSGTAISIANASTSAKGAVQLSSAVDSTSTSLAATPSAVKSAYDLAASKSTVAFSRSLTSGTKIGTITIDGTATDIYCQTNTNTDTKVNVVTRGTTKAYLLATTTTPTSTATAVTSVAETGVYLDTTAGKLVATSFSGNGSALTSLNASNLASGTVPIARIPTGTSSTTVALGNHTHNYAGSSSPGGSATQAETVKSTLNQGLDGDGLSVTEIVWTSQGSSTGYKDLSINDGLQYQTRAGSTSREGLSRLVLGNGTAKGTANNKSGGILVYGSTTKYALITPPDTGFSDDRTLVLPDASGTICLTSHTHSNVSTSAAGFAPKITNTSGYLKGDGTWAVPPDTNTTYTFATGTANGKFKVTPSSGSAYEVAIYGLGSAAYTASTAYLASTTKYAASDSVGGPANQAKQVTGTLNQGHDGESLTVTDITWTTQISGTGYKDLSINDGLQYHTRSGTTTREGLSKVVIGNNIALGTANNKSGGIIIYGCTSTSADIVPPVGGFTASRTLTLPDASGTICLTNHTHNYAGSSSAGGAANSVANKLSIYYNTTKAYDYDGSSAKSLTIKGGTNVTVTGNANGEITIASSYTNTDTKVTQAYSTTNNSYPLLMTATAGVTSTSSRGDTTSILNNRLYANPSTGTVYAGGIIVTQTSDTETKAIRIESPTFNFGLHIGASGNNHGIYDFNKVSGSSTGDWIIYSNDATNTKDYHLKGSAAAIGTAPGTLTSKGSTTNPVYFSSGVPVACTYSLNKTVPSDAVFTDTKVTQNNSTTNADYRVLLSYSASNTNETNVSYKSGNLTFNPSTRVVTSGKYVATWTSYPNQFTQLDGDGLRVAHGDTGGWSKGISFYTNTSMSSADCVIGYFRSSSGAASSYAYFGNSSSDTWFQVADHGYARLYGNRLYISNNPDAVIAHLYGKDSDKHEFPMIGYNATNVWIGANASVGYHHVGGTYISAGYEAKSDTDPTNARNSILVSVPESVSPTSSSGDNKDVYNWEVMHAGCNRYLGHCTTATATADKIVTTAEGHFKRVIGSVISVVFDNAVNASCTLNIDGTGAYSIIVSNNSSISRTIISASEAAIFQVSSGYYIFLGCSTAGSHCVQTFVSSTSSYTNWRPLLVGNSSGQYISTSFASSKGVTYAFNSIRCRPSSGTVAASTFVSTSQALLFSGAYSASDAVQTVTISVTSLFVLYSNVMAVIVTKSYGTINCVLPLAYIKAQGTSGFYEIGAATTTNTSYHLNATYSNDNTLLIKNGTMPSSNSIISVKLIAM